MASCKYYKEIRQVSYDSGVTWISLDEYRKGDLYEAGSSDCGGGITQYRWANIPISQDYICEGTTKYYKMKKQVSYDGGSTWTDVTPPEYQKGAKYEDSSSDCRYITRTTSGTPYCEGYDKYVDVYSQVSYDGGSTWETTATTPTLVEAYSQDCGYIPPTPSPYENQYLTFVARDSGSFKFHSHATSGTLYYSLDSGATWNTLASNTASPTIQSGQKIMWKGDLVPSSSSYPYGIGDFHRGNNRIDNSFDVEGNIMSLLYGDNFVGQRSLSGKDNCFHSLFCDSSYYLSIVNTEHLALPATTLANGCYMLMFWNCTSLITVPKLPATTLASDCYSGMFRHCSSLTSLPSGLLPATSLAEHCYDAMFSYCSSLTTAPELLATTLADACYDQMFRDCFSLTNAPSVLPASTLVFRCYAQMFWNCCQLNYVKCLATSGINTNGSTSNWLGSNSDQCIMSSSGTFVKASNATWPRGASGIPNNWTVQNA